MNERFKKWASTSLHRDVRDWVSTIRRVRVSELTVVEVEEVDGFFWVAFIQTLTAKLV